MIRALDAFLAVRMPDCRPKTEVESSSGPSPDLGFTVNSMDTWRSTIGAIGEASLRSSVIPKLTEPLVRPQVPP